jgi:hypothetical protein
MEFLNKLSDYTKKDLESLSVTELKTICKKIGLFFEKPKKELIFALKEHFEHMKAISESQKKTSKLKIKSVKASDYSSLIEMGKMVERGDAKRLYYANDSFHFELN